MEGGLVVSFSDSYVFRSMLANLWFADDYTKIKLHIGTKVSGNVDMYCW